MNSEPDVQGVRYSSSRLNNRQVDMLVGLAKGIIADGVVTKEEAEFLATWLANNRYTDNAMVDYFLAKIHPMLADGVLDNEEQEQLHSLLAEFVGDPGSLGELLHSTSLPLNDPQPEVEFESQTFLFTGTCAYGTRKECQSFIEKVGGINVRNVTRKLDYLVVGTYVTRSWIHENYGRKIEAAMEYREHYGKPAIIAEATIGFPVPSP